MDIIYLQGLKCKCTIGVWQWEQAMTQTLTLDLELAIDGKKAASEDRLEDALDYQALAQRIQAFTCDNRFSLVETLAERVAELVLQEFATPWLRLKVDKGSAVKDLNHVGVIIERGQRP